MESCFKACWLLHMPKSSDSVAHNCTIQTKAKAHTEKLNIWVSAIRYRINLKIDNRQWSALPVCTGSSLQMTFSAQQHKEIH